MHVHSLGRRVIAALIAIVALPACSPGGPPTGEGSPATTSTPPATGAPETADTDADQRVEVVEVTVDDGQVEPSPGRVDVDLGTVVRIQVTADVSDEVHVHGYDLVAPVSPTAPGVLEFPADIPGAFEVELEGSGLQLFQLRVS